MFNVAQLASTLDREGEEPIYRQLIRHIRAQIDSGSLPSGARLPASRELADSLGISRISVVNAYAELRSEAISAHTPVVARSSPARRRMSSAQSAHRFTPFETNPAAVIVPCAT